MAQWFHVPVNIDPNMKLPKAISHIIDESGYIVATTYDKDRKVTRMISKAQEMYDLIELLLDTNIDNGIWKELMKVKDFIDGEIDIGGDANVIADKIYDGGGAVE